jgi:hypothetical protein
MKNLEKMFSNDWLIKNTNEKEINECYNNESNNLLDNALDNVKKIYFNIYRFFF